jgi:hypothetical protein
MRRFSSLLFLMLLLAVNGKCQNRPAQFEDPGHLVWMGSYNAFRITEKLFWRAEFHYRRSSYEDVKFIGRMTQIYNRHALNYVLTPNFNFSLGGVLRLNFTPEPGNEDFEPIMHEPRIWHEYMFIMPYPRFQIFHRIRIEHRWSQNNRVGSDWVYRDRWRYKYFMKIPINKKQLIPGTFFANPDVEIIMQSGKTVGGSPLEDLRIYPSVGYIVNPRVTYTAGLMYTTGQRIFDGTVYRQRWVVRINAYISLDFRKEEKRIPSVKLSD